ncbi:MAG: Gfo/Idh/MocA family oxidoreductase [Verrucomicrobiota bacterium JB022]|nr:Gfo/Idh/MocA family oxidoreductase [Verrucomicrobiota bacterium JB022]
MKPVHWAIVGTGDIASEFARGLKQLPGQAVRYAVVSRTHERAQRFAEKYGFATATDDFDAVLADPKVRAVYIATPHPAHFATARDALQAGKAVLCEKPVTLNARQFDELQRLAVAQGAFFMEAMKTPFQPAIQRAMELVDRGDLGPIRHLEASFCFHAPRKEGSRFYEPSLGGGGLLDVGVYPLSLAYLLLGAPESTDSALQMGPTGVDEQAALLCRYASGASAFLRCGIYGSQEESIRIFCEDGQIELLHLRRWDPQGIRWRAYHGEWQEEAYPTDGSPLSFEAEEVYHCLAEGLKESAVVPHRQTHAVLAQIDALRSKVGLVYPGDAE